MAVRAELSEQLPIETKTVMACNWQQLTGAAVPHITHHSLGHKNSSHTLLRGLTGLWESPGVCALRATWLVFSPFFSADFSVELPRAKKQSNGDGSQLATLDRCNSALHCSLCHQDKPSAPQLSHLSVLVLTKLFCAATSLGLVTQHATHCTLAEPKEVVNRDWQQLMGAAVLQITCLGAQRQAKC